MIGIIRGDEEDFQEVSGLDFKITTEDVQEGGINSYTPKLPKGVQKV